MATVSIAKKRQILFINPRQLLKFDEIYPTFAEFALRHKRMCLAKPFGDFDLGQTGLAASPHQTGKEPFVCLVITLVVDIHPCMYIQS